MRTNINTTPFTPRDRAAYEYGYEIIGIGLRVLDNGALKSAEGGTITATISDAVLALDGPMGWHAQRPHDDQEPMATWLHRVLRAQADDARRWAVAVIRDRAESTPGWEPACVDLFGVDDQCPARGVDQAGVVGLIAVAPDSRMDELVVCHVRDDKVASIWAAWTADEPLDAWLARRMGPADDEDEGAALANIFHDIEEES